MVWWANILPCSGRAVESTFQSHEGQDDIIMKYCQFCTVICQIHWAHLISTKCKASEFSFMVLALPLEKAKRHHVLSLTLQLFLDCYVVVANSMLLSQMLNSSALAATLKWRHHPSCSLPGEDYVGGWMFGYPNRNFFLIMEIVSKLHGGKGSDWTLVSGVPLISVREASWDSVSSYLNIGPCGPSYTTVHFSKLSNFFAQSRLLNSSPETELTVHVSLL